MAVRVLRAGLVAVLVVVVAGCALFVLARPIKTPLNYYDEGLVLLNATNILHGDVPYKDFWTLYSAGYYYMLAAVLRVSGATVLAARVFDLVQRALLVLTVYLTARRFVSGWVALVPFALAVLWLGSTGFYSYPVFPALMYTLLACLCLFRYFDTRRARWLILTGAGTGLALAIRHDLGAFAAVGLGLGLLLYELARREDVSLGGPSGLRSAARPLFYYALGISAVAVPLILYLAIAGDLRAMWHDLVVFPSTGFRAYRDLPKPGLVPDLTKGMGERLEDWVRFYVPLLVYACAAIVVLAAVIRRRAGKTAWAAESYGRLTAVAATGLFTFNQALGRYEALHVLPSQLLALLTATALLGSVPTPAWKRPWVWLGIALAVPTILWMPYVAHYYGAWREAWPYRPGESYSSLPRSSGVPLQQGEQMAVEYIRQHTAPGDYVFVGNTHHDLIVVNDLGFYFLADRRSPSIYQELHPGMATTTTVQQEIVDRLRERQVEYVVRVRVWEPCEPNQSAVSSGVTCLDQFIEDNYESCFQSGNYEVRRRKR